MKKILSFFNKIKDKLIYAYTSGNSVLTAIITITFIVAVSVTGIIMIKALTAVTPDVADAANTEKLTPVSIEESLPTVPETTTVEETTTEEPTTEEMTTEEETTIPPETIPIEEISYATEIIEEYDPKHEAVEQVTEPPTEKPTSSQVQKPSIPPSVSEVAQVVKGIDVSYWQGDIDWKKVKEDGVKFVIIRCGYRTTGSGKLAVDPKFQQNIEGALANGIQSGVYFFSQAITMQEVREEASLTLELIKNYKLTYPVVYDWETGTNFRNTNAHLSKSTVNAMAVTFCDIISSAGYTPMIYGNPNDFQEDYDIQPLAAKYKIWLARYFNKYNGTGVQYKAGDELPSTSFPYQMWQYSCTGRVNGINGNVDMNVGFFTYSGSQVPTTPLTLNVPSDPLTTNIGIQADIMSGVSAYNTAGLESTSQVTAVIKNSSNANVNASDAFNIPGTYTIVYSFNDFTGASTQKTRTLIVRDNPVITLTNSSLIYSYEEAVNKKSELADIINTNIASAVDYEGTDLINIVKITYDDSLINMLNCDGIIAGTYNITYSVDDGKGLSAKVEMTITIKDIEQESTTIPPETTSLPETTTGNEAASSEETTSSIENNFTDL